MATVSTRSLSLLWLCAALACGSDPMGMPDPGEPTDTVAPLCSTIAGGGPKELFAQPVVPTDAVTEALIFGGMDPGTLEPINFELGFLLGDTNVPVVAPADLYVRSLEYTRYMTGFRAGVTDYGMTFQVCAVEDVEGRASPAVTGAFQHITSLSAELQAMVDSLELDCFVDDANPEEVAEKCAAFLPAGLAEDGGLVIAAGTTIGGAGGTGANDYTPGFDFNLMDERYPNAYVNPDRLGAEEGPGHAFRYGACVYEYFAEPHRSAYLAAVGQNGEPRASESDPCGTLGFGVPGTAAGVWILEDGAGLTLESAYVQTLESLLVLGPHPVTPGTHQVLSSELPALSDVSGRRALLTYAPDDGADVNPDLYAVAPGTIYCIESEPYGAFEPHAHLLELEEGGERLTI